MGPNLQSKVNGGGWVDYWDKLLVPIRKLIAYFRLESCANLGFLIKFMKFWNLGLNLANLAKFRPNSLILALTLGFGGLRARWRPAPARRPGDIPVTTWDISGIRPKGPRSDPAGILALRGRFLAPKTL